VRLEAGRGRHRGERGLIIELAFAVVVAGAAGIARLARRRREVCPTCWKRTLVGDQQLRDYRCEHCGEQCRRQGLRLIRLADWGADERPGERLPTATVVSKGHRDPREDR